eukprot:362119_1
MMPKALKLRQFEKDLVVGYYRSNYNEYISNDIKQLSMMFLWILEEFDDKTKTRFVKIKGLNNNIFRYIGNENTYPLYGTVFGRHIISKSKQLANNYYHWRFKIVSRSITASVKENFIVGLIKESLSDSLVFVGSHASVKQNDNLSDYGKKFNKKGDILDMYLDLNKGQLSFIINNNDCGVAFDNINTNINYRMTVSLCGNKSCIRLISYHASSFYDMNNKIASNYIGYGRSIYNVSEKLKYYEYALESHKNHGIIEWHNEYIDCLIIKQEYENAYKYISKNNVEKINIVSNLPKIIDYLQENKQYKE